jgi:hypothetical protein
MIGTVGPTALLTALNKPRDGVIPPPFVRLEQSSSLSAPPRTALFDHDCFIHEMWCLFGLRRAPTNAIADSTESTQISMTSTPIPPVLPGLCAKIRKIRAGI